MIEQKTKQKKNPKKHFEDQPVDPLLGVYSL